MIRKAAILVICSMNDVSVFFLHHYPLSSSEIHSETILEMEIHVEIDSIPIFRVFTYFLNYDFNIYT